MTDGQGADLILDPVLGTFFEDHLDCLAMDSRWIIYGSMGGFKVKEGANLLKLLSKRSSILTSTLRNRSDSYKTELIKEMAEECIPAFENE